MSAQDWIDNCQSEIEKLVVARNRNSVGLKINKLRSWLQKHQYDTLADGGKTKLLQILIICQRYCQSLSGEERVNFEEFVTSLFSDYLQLPEGKLVSSKDKKKVMLWLQNLGAHESESSKKIKGREIICIVIDINEESQEVIGQSEENDEIFEALACCSEDIWNSIKSLFNVDSNAIIRVSVNSENQIFRLI
jgi:hypothetical protein